MSKPVTKTTKTIYIDANRKDRDYIMVEYHALDGTVFYAHGPWYEMQELANDCSRQAYEADTALSFIVIF